MIFAVCFSACEAEQKQIDITKLSGYWEIQKVTAPGQDRKEYKVNETFDHYELKQKKGIRSKVKPQFDGTFLTNDQSEQFTLVNEKGDTYLNYVTPFASWREQIVVLEDSALVIRNEQKQEFHYKKAGPLNFTGDGETTK
jgi:hypothetical protein